MSVAELHEQKTEMDQVREWRREELTRAGYPDDIAGEIAGRFDIDLHAAVGLLRQGCSPDIASRILL